MRKRIYGLETEYAVFLTPESPHARVPTRREVFEILEEILARRYRTMRSRIAKRGLFLENSALIHYEAQVDQYANGLIEVATPECTNPLQTVCWHEATQRILQDALPEIRARLRERGYKGSVSFGKNSTDGKGNFYGSHENYLVDDTPGTLRRWGLRAVYVLFLACYPIMALLANLPLLILLVFLLLGAGVHLLCRPLRRLWWIGRLFRGIQSGMEWTYNRVANFPEEKVHRWMGAYTRVAIFPFVEVYSRLLSPLLFPRFKRYLTPFLVTRQIFTGSGRVDFSSGLRGSHLSQKAEAIQCLCRIFWDDARRPIYDIKNFIRPPFGLLHPHRRLHLLMSDSNMSEVATYLKLGLTGLVLEMIEAGVRFDDVQLQDPIPALRDVSRDPTLCGRLLLRNGNALTPIEIQRRYLEEAKLFFSGQAEADPTRTDLLRRWEALLDTLQENPHYLYKEIDWVAKMDLVEEALRDGPGWARLAVLAPLIEAVDPFLPEIPASERGDEALARLFEARLPGKLFQQVRRELTDKDSGFAELVACIETYYRVQKIDLKYHDLDPQEGYFFRLRADGLVTRVLEDAAIESARTEPPTDTRAHLRGHLIKRFHDPVYEGTVDWVLARIGGARRLKVRFPDPFDPGKPEDLPPGPAPESDPGRNTGGEAR